MKPVHQCIKAQSTDSLNDVLRRLKDHDITGVPVLDGKKFSGMISEQMIYKAYFEHSGRGKDEFLQYTKAKDILDHKDLFIKDDEVFEKTLTSFKGFPILAVIDDQHYLKGIVTRSDVLEQFESAFGLHKKGVRIAFTSTESEGRIARMAELLKHYHENVISIATFDETDKLARRIVLKIDKKDNVDQFIKRLEKAGFRILSVKEM
ncbi:CBS domain-containing protein [Melghiribacillus thermohalophilus]|nr:CBS domain-containing protein [Melghiribacillus thermohalophilus]